MRSNALFFPYIALPNDAWTAKSLLYWDKLSSIVPLDHLDRPGQMSNFMRALLVEDLVEPIVPSLYIHQIKEFDASFIELIEHRLRQPRSGRKWEMARMHMEKLGDMRGMAPMHMEKFGDISGGTRIHMEKLGDISNFLVQSGLARRSSGAWYEVETTTANLFMTYLATCLGAIPEVDATPVTNNMAFATSLRPCSEQSARHPMQKDASRGLVLHRLLPAPAGRIDLAKLLSFKRKFGHLLPPLRLLVEDHCSRVAILPEASDRTDANEAFLQRCKQDVAEIEEAMRPTFGKVMWGSLLPLFGAGLTLQGTDPGNTMTHAGAALTFANAIYQAIDSIQSSRVVKNRPLAYIAHARRALATT